MVEKPLADFCDPLDLFFKADQDVFFRALNFLRSICTIGFFYFLAQQLPDLVLEITEIFSK